ncbi:MAG TPA: bifunctional adenosylcobinamide kinase/adenosylcobinamide-phosphate guanylyltransferase [Rhodospirillales bacterium]|nr:bifunctional adenosylcobinamide kinase/adenosylcobinamide-phosphate guanylyltransferase [Rhodospirillales bacterium]
MRSGKSRRAEDLVAASGLARVYLATAVAGDTEMEARIAAHRRRRGRDWRTVEVPLRLPEAILAESRPDRILLVDCLTLWLTNLLMAKAEPATAFERLAEALAARRGPVVLVSNEVGLGVVPADPLGRRFVDLAGDLHRRLAALADRVELVVAGLPLVLKPKATE